MQYKFVSNSEHLNEINQEALQTQKPKKNSTAVSNQ